MNTVGLDRRQFLKGTGSVAAALVVQVALPLTPSNARAEAAVLYAPNAFIRIDMSGLVTFTMPMAEMGQGVHTAHAMLLAEELEVSLDTIKLEQSPPDDAKFANPMLQVQTTGMSTSVRAFWLPLRQAGAVARTMLVSAAATKWQVDPRTLKAQNGYVTDGWQQIPYGELVEAASQLPVPDAGKIALKDISQLKLIGKSIRRLEAPDKVNGKAQFGIDVLLPGLKFAAVAISPVRGGKVQSIAETAVRAVKGVRQIVNLGDVVAVVADHTGAARKGLEAAAIAWNDGVNGTFDSTSYLKQLEAESAGAGAVARSEGDWKGAMSAAKQRIDAIYQLPFLAHAAMEPMNCTVHVQKGGCDIWVGTQAPSTTQRAVAEVLGLPLEQVRVHNHLIGGGFGRRLDVDGSILAARIASKVNGPVKVIWSREEDIQHDLYRPYYYDRISAGLDDAGRPVAWTHRIAASSVVARFLPPLFKDGLDFDAVEGAAAPPYVFANMLVDYVRVEPQGVLTGFWRGVGPVHNVFVIESFLDELALASAQDPVAYREALLAHNPRALAVLKLAASSAGWTTPLPPGQGRGISLQASFGSYVAQVAEVSVGADGSVKVSRVVCAVDCGIAVNPDTIEAQVQGGTLFGLTAALHGAITFANGRVEQSNFDTYLPMRIDEVPVVETHIVQSREPPGGLGEAPTAAVAPAVTNAIFAASGKRVRTLPIDPTYLKRSN